MKYTVRIGNAAKEIEATRFYYEGGFVVFANHVVPPPQNQYGGGIYGHLPPQPPSPVAAYPSGLVDSIESSAVTTQTAPAPKKAGSRRG